MSFVNFFVLLLKLIPKPVENLKLVKNSEKKLKFGIYSLLLFSVLTMTNMLLYHFQGLIPVPGPWLIIPPELSFLYSFYLMIPVAFLGAILFSGITQLLCKPFNGKGTFEGQFSLFSVAYPIYFMLLHVIKTIFFFIFRESLAGYPLFVVIALSYIMTLISVKIEQEIKWIPSLIISFIGFGVTALFSLTYIR